MVDEKKADQLFKEFKEISVTDFFRKNKAHLGYTGKIRSLTTVVHELVTNSFDACEEAGILPEITVEIQQLGKEHYRFIERDNGPGIPKKHIGKVFGSMLAGTKFHRNVQLRGQQGIGVAGVTMFSQMTSGKPLKVITSTGDGKIYDAKLMIDTGKNRADVVEEQVYDESEYFGYESYGEYTPTLNDFYDENNPPGQDKIVNLGGGNWHGTHVECEVKDVIYNLSEWGPYEYLRRTAIVNPHAQITFVDPEGKKTVFERTSSRIPDLPVEVKPHPGGVKVDDLVQMAKASVARNTTSFLLKSFSRMSRGKVREIQEHVSFNLKKRPGLLKWAECEEIIDAFRRVKFLAPSLEGLSPIGEEQINASVLSILDPEFEAVLTRKPKVHSGGIGFQIEVAVAYGRGAGKKGGENGDEKGAEIMRFANRAPLLFDAGGCAITQAVRSIDWRRYDIGDFNKAPITVVVNLISTYIPYTSAGKQSVANEENIEKEIRSALQELGRKFTQFHSKRRRSQEVENKRKLLLKYCGEVATATAKLTGGDEDVLYSNLTSLIEDKLKGGVF
ncbi:MAG: DNA topoisomerase VI subunit B [Candidatus Altiarchaeales archaeon WOR_SM1_86-2]|nr:MAG: DNA topoisomerase VI subunit B [Candidatus Altiarchaeales archaeon WOR_SM1_86-2]